MPSLHISPLSRLHETIAACSASHVITLMGTERIVERPPGITPERHLIVTVSDIIAPLEGHILPGEEHVQRLLEFVQSWDRARPLVIHCWAGISRSTAGAYMTACALSPQRCEAEIAQCLRAASPCATPNSRLVALADQMLAREGRMIRAIEAIGRGVDACEGTPFQLDLD